MSRRNFLQETIDNIESEGKSVSDVQWVGTEDGLHAITWNEFASMANFGYDSGYGSEEIPLDLVVVGDSWWLERHEYDGAEWWEFKSLPTKSENSTPFKISKGDHRYEITEP